MSASQPVLVTEQLPISGECTGGDARTPAIVSAIGDAVARECTDEVARSSIDEGNGLAFRSELGRDPDLWLYRERP